MKNIKKFSDFANEDVNLEGEKLSPQEVFGKPIVLTAVRFFTSKVVRDKDCVQMQFYFVDDEEEKRYVVFSTSTVLTRQAREYEGEIPFQTTIITSNGKTGKYHSFS